MTVPPAQRSRARVLVAATLALATAMSSLGKAQGSESLYSLIRDDNRAFELSEARKLLRSSKKLAAVELLRSVLRCSPSAVVEPTKGRWVGLREAARDALGALDPEARKIYERMVEPELAPRLREVLQRRAASEISSVAQRYPASLSSRAARIYSGDLFLEEGRTLRALREFDLVWGGSDDRDLRMRRLFGRALAGIPVNVGEIAAGRATFSLGGRDYTRAQLEATLDALRSHENHATWDSYGGGLSNTRRPIDPVDARELFWEARIEHLDTERQPLNLFPTSDARRVFVNTGTRLYGIDLYRGVDGNSWSSISPIADVSSMSEQHKYLSGVSNNFAHSSALAGGRVVAPLQVPIVPPTANNNHNFNHIPIMRRLPVRRLHCFDTESGRLLWAHFDARSKKAPRRLRNLPLDVSGPPLIVDDTVYVLTHSQIGTIALYLCAFDLADGSMRWKTLICSSQTEVNMFGNRSSEFAAPPLAYARGVIYGGTNLGLCFAARTDDGSLRWIQEYPIIPIPRSRMRPRPRPTFWANNPPVVAEGRVVFTPLDSTDAICVATESGALKWKLRYDIIDHARGIYSQLRWLLGVVDGQAWFGGNAIARVDMQRGRVTMVASAATLGVAEDLMTMIPRPLLTEERIYFQSPSGGLRVLDHDGQLKTNMQRRAEHVEIGNMMAAGSVLVTARPRSVHAYYSLEELLARARQAVTDAPDDPSAALAYAELLGARSQPTEHELMTATQRFRDVLALVKKTDLGDGSPLALRAESGLFSKLRSLAKARRDLGREDQAREMIAEALAIGRELWHAEALEEDELIRMSIASVRGLPIGDANRERLLDILESEHGRSEFSFGGARKAKVGLFVLIRRIADLESRGEEGAAAQLALLRKILVQYGDDTLPDPSDRAELARSFAIDNIATLVARHGRQIYAPFETEAKRLLASAGEDRGKLQVVLEQYPTSAAAQSAIVKLATIAASRGDLSGALEAFRLGRARMAQVPKALLEALSEAAKANGNPVLSEHLRARADGSTPQSMATVKHAQMRGPATLQLQHAPKLSTGSWSSSLRVERVAEFDKTDAPALPLLLYDGVRLAAFSPTIGGRKTGSEQSRVVDGKPAWTTAYEDPMRDLGAAIYGDVLVLPEERRIRGLSLRDGREIWSVTPRDFSSAAGRGFIKARRLSNGLYGAFVGSVDFSSQGSLVYVGLEPRSGGVCHATQMDTPVPIMRDGACFTIERAESVQHWQLRIHDPLRGREDKLVFDGTAAPELRTLVARDVIITQSEVFVLVSFEVAVEASGVFAWKRGPDGLQRSWTYECDSQNQDSFVVCGSELLLTENFEISAEGVLHRIDRASGALRRKVSCGVAASVLDRVHSQEARAITILGESDSSRAQLTYVDTRAGAESWAVEVPPSILPMPAPPDLPAPAYGPREVALVIPRANESHARNYRVVRFDRRNAKRLESKLGLKPWRESAEANVWNGALLVRTRSNAWLFGDKIKVSPKRTSK